MAFGHYRQLCSLITRSVLIYISNAGLERLDTEEKSQNIPVNGVIQYYWNVEVLNYDRRIIKCSLKVYNP